MNFAERVRSYGVTPRMMTMTGAAVVTFVALLVMMINPVPYGVQGPGPTFDTLGESNGTPLIEVSGDTPTYATSGELLMTTVTTSGGPGFPAYAGTVIQGWLSPSRVVAPVETYFDPSQSQQDLDAQSAQQMIGSQQNATVAALTELGYDVPAVLTIIGTAQGLGADGVALDGDVITGYKVDGELVPVGTYQVLSDYLSQTPPGSTVTLVVDRAGTSTDLQIVTSDDGAGGSVLGVYLSGDFDYPVDVHIQIDNVGGPSAGTMFALGIIDTLTPGEMTGGHIIAGTGTMSLGGLVGPIGGIQQKLVGADDAGAEYFLAPAANCDEVVGHVPSGLQVVRIATLEQARDAVEAIGAGDAADLPTC